MSYNNNSFYAKNFWEALKSLFMRAYNFVLCHMTT